MNAALRSRWSALVRTKLARRAAKLAIVLVALRMLLWLATPLVVQLAARSRGLECDWSDLRLSLAFGELELRGVSVRARAMAANQPATPLARIERLHLNVDLASTLLGEPRVSQLELDGVDVWLAIAADGSSTWERLLAAPEGGTTPADETPAALQFAPPASLHARWNAVRIHYRDLSTAPAVELALCIDGRLDLERGDGELVTWLSAGAALRSARFQCQFGATASGLDARFEGALEQLDLTQLQGRLRAAGLEALGAPLDGALDGELRVQVLDAQSRLLAAQLDVRNGQLDEGGVRVLASDGLRVELSQPNAQALTVELARLENPFLRTTRRSDGRVAFAGLTAFAGAPAPDANTPREQSSFALVLKRLELSGGALEFDDHAAPQPTLLELRDARVDVVDVRLGALDAPHEAGFSCSARAPGLAGVLRLDGSVLAGPQSVAVTVHAAASEVTLERVHAQLEQLGLVREFAHAEASITLTAGATLGDTPEFHGAIEHLRWNAEGDQFALQSARTSGVSIVPREVSIAQLEVAGARASVRRDASGVVHALGFALTPREAQTPRELSTNAPTPTPALACVLLGAVDVRDLALSLVDESTAPETRLELRDVTLNARDLALGAPTAPRSGSLSASFTCDGVVEQAKCEAAIEVDAQATNATGAFDARGLDLHPLAGWLAPLGFAPTLSQGSARGQVSFRARRSEHSWSADFALRDAQLAQAGEVLASVGVAAIDGLELPPEPRDVRFESAVLERAFVRVERDERGALEFIGLRATGAPSPTSAPDQSSNAASNDTSNSIADFALAAAAVGASDLELAWRDRAVDPPLELVLRAQAGATQIDVGSGAPMRIEASVSVDGVLREAHAQLELALNRDALRLTGELAAAGLDPRALSVYLPADLSFDAHEAGAAAQLELSIVPAPSGGLAMRGAFTDVELREGERMLAGVERIAFDAPRLDASAAEFELNSLEVLGAKAAIEQRDDGEWSFAGLKTSKRPEAARTVPSTPDAPIRRVRSRTPRVVVGDVRLELEELSIGGVGASPLAFALSLRHEGPRVWLGPQAEDSDPIALSLAGALAPICGAFELDARASPFAASPEFTLRAKFNELSGAALLELRPELAQRIDAASLTQGELSFEADARLDLRRRSPLELDPDAPIGFEGELRALEFRAEPAGEVLAGLGALRIDGGSFSPRAPSARIASIEFQAPRFRASRDAQALNVLGLRVLLASTEAGAADPDAPAPSVAALVDSAAATAEIAPPFDLTVERVVASGLDVELLDTSGPQPARIPLERLDAELKRFSLPGLARGEALAFRATVGAGALELPPRVVADSLLEGMAHGVADLLDGTDAPRANEQRPLFAELNVSGKLAPFPAPSGWATLNLESLELPALRGPALARGLEVGDGLADIDVRLRFAGANGMSVDARTSFAHLSLSEPADGPLSRFLALPAPLDTVLFLLKDAEGRHKLSLGFRVEADGLSKSSLAACAAGAAAGVIARAVASSPLRLLSTLSDAAGITGADAPPASEIHVLGFAAGDATLGLDAPPLIAALAERLRGRPRKGVVLEHELSPADLERAARLVNPSLADCARLTARLREHKAELSRERDARAAQTRAEFALADPARMRELSERLRSLEARLGQGEEALERLLELSRPGAERRATARARAAAVSLGAERLERARRALRALGLEDARILTRVVKPEPNTQLEGGGRLRLWVR